MMKISKKALVLVMAALVAMSLLAGCGGGSGSGSSSEAPASQDAGAAPGGSEAGDENPSTDGDGLKIAIVTSPSGVDDGSFNQDNYVGVTAFIQNHPDATVTAVQELDMANSVNAVADIMAEYDVIVTPGYQFAGISTLANDNPDKLFVLIDSTPDEVDGQTEFDNVLSMMFKEQESGFFAGIAAALETETGKVAVVNGIAFPSNVNYQFGFMAGVNYANAHYGTAAEIVEIAAYAGTDVLGNNVGGNYVQDFNDEATGKIVGSALIDAGCDILFVAAGNSGNGVFTAAKENGNVMVIGCDVDQFDDGVNGDSNIILTSGLKVMSINVERALEDIVGGTFQGGNVLLGADTDSTGYVSADGRHQLGAETLEKLEEAYGLVKSGAVVPPYDITYGDDNNDPAAFPGLA